jgi:heterodisulfide reductase subunit C
MVIFQFLFIVITLAVFGMAARQAAKIYRNINLGKQDYTAEDNFGTRLKNMTLVALGQQKMFARPMAAVLHLFIYVAFVITQVELIEIFIDGFFGTHRFFQPFLGEFYWFCISFIEFLSVLALVATIAFLARRFYLKLARFQSPELRGFPMFDAALILVLEIVLVTCIFTMNSTDLALQHRNVEGFHHTGGFLVSQFIAPLWDALGFSNGALMILERLGWWGHYAGVLGFIVWLPFSKHLHIVLAFFNTYYAPIKSRGAMDNMPVVQHEVETMMAEMMGTPAPEGAPMPENYKFGASDVFDLSWKNLMDAYTCTECGRCTSVCPANATGKLLSPRKIMMDVRDRIEEVGTNLDSQNLDLVRKDQRRNTLELTPENYDDGKSLFDFITTEELRACTTCNACVEACPIMISPLDIIMELRRNQILEKSDSPEAWNVMFSNIENNRAPWQFSPDDRDKWTQEM